MEHYRLNNLDITLEREGAKRFTKASYPIRYGRFCEIETQKYLFQFNLNGEIKYIRGFTQDWPHPAEWLKRTDADDWVYYSTGGYRGIFHALGEYYLPCLSYPSNSVYGYNPFYTFINIGLESADAATLRNIQKPLEIPKIEDAFQMMLAVNRSYPNLEITANFLLGDHLSAVHYQALVELIRNRLDRYYSKGAIYLSPLNTSHDNRKLLSKFVEIKNLSRLPTYLYLIQRL